MCSTLEFFSSKILMIGLITLQSVVQVTPIWKCSNKFGPRPIFPETRPPEPNPVRCGYNSALDRFIYLPHQILGNGSILLPTTEYGIEGIQIASIKHFNETLLKLSIEERFGFGEKEIPDKLELKNETKVIQVMNNSLANLQGSPPVHSIFYQGRFPCHAGPGPNPEEFSLYTNPLQYNFPPVGNCTPTDQYVPIQYWDTEPWLTCLQCQTRKVVRFQIPFGLYWTSGPFFKIDANSMNGGRAELFWRNYEQLNGSPVLVLILKELSARFAQLNPSPATKVKWDPSFTRDNLTMLTLAESIFEYEAILEPFSATILYRLIGHCGNYSIATDQIYKRVYDTVNGTCKGYKGAKAGVETCDFCKDVQWCNDKVTSQEEFINTFTGLYKETHFGLKIEKNGKFV